MKKHIENGVEPKDDLIVSNYSLELGTHDENFSEGEVFSQQLMYGGMNYIQKQQSKQCLTI